MSGGVKFDRGSARRISNAVRTFERQGPDLSGRARGTSQRQLGLVYEVQSVDTGNSECDVQRYDGSSGVGETLTCRYDSEPSTGDLGTVLRQADGSLFFFSRTQECLAYSTDDTRIVENLDTGSNIQLYSTYDGSSWSNDVDILGVGKFDSPLSMESGSYGILFAPIKEVQGTCIVHDGDESAPFRSDITLKIFTEDVTLASVTGADIRNNLANINTEVFLAAHDGDDFLGTSSESGIAGLLTAGADYNIYGFAIYIDELVALSGTNNVQYGCFVGIDSSELENVLLTLFASVTIQ